jgi:hypothetical protein
MKELKLPSGAVLKIQVSPFSVSKALYQALLKELKDIPISAKTEVSSLYKDLFCIGFASPVIESCLWKCFERCTYNYGAGDFKIDDQTFESVERRDDYMMVCMEVAKENVLPFAKSLYAEYQRIMSMPENIPA